MSRGWAGAMVAGLLLVSACGGKAGPADDGGDQSPKAASWTRSTDPVRTDGLVWASGTEVHLPGDVTVDAGGDVARYVVAGDGVYLFTAKRGQDVYTDDDGNAELVFAGPNGTTRTGLRLQGDTLTASPDGRYLAGLDTGSGRKDRFGTRQAVVTVYDLRTGRKVVRSTAGMGDPGEDDLADGYGDAEIGIPAMTDETVYVAGLDGDYAYTLATGERRALSATELTKARQSQDAGSLTSPDGRWRIEETADFRDRLVPDEGSTVTPRTGTPRWTLRRWLDDTTVFGTATSGPGRGKQVEPGDSSALMTCVVPEGSCTVVKESTGRKVVFPANTSDGGSLTLLGGDDASS